MVGIFLDQKNRTTAIGSSIGILLESGPMEGSSQKVGGKISAA